MQHIVLIPDMDGYEYGPQLVSPASYERSMHSYPFGPLVTTPRGAYHATFASPLASSLNQWMKNRTINERINHGEDPAAYCGFYQQNQELIAHQAFYALNMANQLQTIDSSRTTPSPYQEYEMEESTPRGGASPFPMLDQAVRTNSYLAAARQEADKMNNEATTEQSMRNPALVHPQPFGGSLARQIPGLLLPASKVKRDVQPRRSSRSIPKRTRADGEEENQPAAKRQVLDRRASQSSTATVPATAPASCWESDPESESSNSGTGWTSPDRKQESSSEDDEEDSEYEDESDKPAPSKRSSGTSLARRVSVLQAQATAGELPDASLFADGLLQPVKLLGKQQAGRPRKDQGLEEGDPSLICRSKLPGRVVGILRSFFLEHAIAPFPCDTDKAMLMATTGLTMKQVCDWFTNNRKRYWRNYERKLTRLNCGLVDGLRRTRSGKRETREVEDSVKRHCSCGHNGAAVHDWRDMWS